RARGDGSGRPARRRRRQGRSRHRGRRAGYRRPPRPAARASHRRDPSAGTAAGPVRTARTAAARPLLRSPPFRGARLPRHQFVQGPIAMTPEDTATAPQPDSVQAPKIEARAGGAPTDAMIVVPVRQTVLFPEIVFPITVNRP